MTASDHGPHVHLAHANPLATPLPARCRLVPLPDLVDPVAEAASLTARDVVADEGEHAGFAGGLVAPSEELDARLALLVPDLLDPVAG